ncbi:MAG: metallophosphoesterase family protein [Chloroflexota bacterium]
MKPIIAALFIAAFFAGCKDDDSPSNSGQPETTIAVASDLHSYDLSLGHSGEAWKEYLAMDRKLLDENEAIFDAFVQEMKNNSGVKIILIPGDLTKDGEEASHVKLAGKLRELEKAGKKIFVIPGNHDIANPGSRSYHTDASESTPNITADKFATIYAEFGYSEAVSRDPNSLSYIVEPTPGVWIFALDAAKYRENPGQPAAVPSGKFRPETITWMRQKLSEGKSLGKVLIGFMHFGLVEHFTGQKTLSVSSEYVLDDWNTVAPQLMDAGLNLVFTGHFHANDITAYQAGGKTLYDVETASLVGYPSSYRVVKITRGNASVSTKTINNVNWTFPEGLTFQLYAEREIKKGMTGLAAYMLTNPPFNLNNEQAEYLAPYIGDAFVRHYKGNETIPTETQLVINNLKGSPDTAPLGMALESMLTDLAPDDNAFTVPLAK